MSFARGVKLEIIENKPYRMRNKFAQAYGLLIFCRNFSCADISISTELSELAELYRWFLRGLLGKGAELSVSERRLRGKNVYTASLKSPKDRVKLFEMMGEGTLNPELLTEQADVDAFISGAFLACGSVNDPEKSYRLEFSCREAQLGGQLRELLISRIGSALMSKRRGGVVVYIKECSLIEDLLAMMGATKSALSVIDVEMIKEVRNRANRATNCETANIDKQVDAAQKQLADIELVLSNVGEEGLSEALLQAARLRREHPAASLRELCALSPDPVSRSGMFHRFAQLSKMAEEIRGN